MKIETFKILIKNLEDGCGEEYDKHFFQSQTKLCGISGLCRSCFKRYIGLVNLFLESIDKTGGSR